MKKHQTLEAKQKLCIYFCIMTSFFLVTHYSGLSKGLHDHAQTRIAHYCLQLQQIVSCHKRKTSSQNLIFRINNPPQCKICLTKTLQSAFEASAPKLYT